MARLTSISEIDPIPKRIYTNHLTLWRDVRSEISRLGTDANLNHLDVSEITNMFSLFCATGFCGDVSLWDVRNGKTFEKMFYRTKFSDTFDISKWDVSNAINMSGMFMCSDFKGNISGWNVGKVENMSGMFMCSSFNGDISGWDVGNVNIFSEMFHYNGCFHQDLSSWDLTSATSMKKMSHLSAMKEEDVSAWKPKLKDKPFTFGSLFNML